MGAPIEAVVNCWRQLTTATASEYKAWYLVPLLVLLALGATVLIGALAWCMMHGQNLGFIKSMLAPVSTASCAWREVGESHGRLPSGVGRQPSRTVGRWPRTSTTWSGTPLSPLSCSHSA